MHTTSCLMMFISIFGVKLVMKN